MKKLFSLSLVFASCYGTLHALPIGNPADPALLCDGLFFEGSCCILDICDPGGSWCDAFSFRAGFYGDYVFQRSMEIDRHEDSSFIEDTEIFTNAGYVVVNIWDRLDIFATFGATNIRLATNDSAFLNSGLFNGNRTIIDSETAFSWSFGGRLIVWQCGCTVLGAEAQYFYTKPDIEIVTVRQSSTVYPDDKGIDMKYREWQFGLAISHRINILVPYAGIKWSRAQIDMDNANVGIILFNLKTRKDVGYALGVTLTDCCKKSLTLEARFADEKAVYVNGQIRF